MGVDKTFDAALGIADCLTIQLVPSPHEVYQLEGHKPDVATLAYNLMDARRLIAEMLGLKELPESAKVVRLS